MTTIQAVAFKKKISVLFADGTRKQNLNVRSAVELTAQLPQVTVTVAEDEPHARELLEQFLAESEARLEQTVEGYTAVFQAAHVAQVVAETARAEPTSAPVSTPSLEVPIAEPAAQPKARGERPVRGYIILGPRDVYTDAQVALNDIRRGPFSPLPENYHNKLTQTFMVGKPAGQIKSLFRDLKLYGLAIAPKRRPLDSQPVLFRNADFLGLGFRGLADSIWLGDGSFQVRRENVRDNISEPEFLLRRDQRFLNLQVAMNRVDPEVQIVADEIGDHSYIHA